MINYSNRGNSIYFLFIEAKKEIFQISNLKASPLRRQTRRRIADGEGGEVNASRSHSSEMT